MRTLIFLVPGPGLELEAMCQGHQVLLASPRVRSQNHRMVGVGRDVCGSSSPTPCRSRVTYSRLHRTLSRQMLVRKQLMHFRIMNWP